MNLLSAIILSSGTSNTLTALVSNKPVRFKQTSETVCTDGRVTRVPDEIRVSVFAAHHKIQSARSSPNLTEKCSAISPGNPLILRSKGQRSKSRVTKTRQAWVCALLRVLAASRFCSTFIYFTEELFLCH